MLNIENSLIELISKSGDELFEELQNQAVLPLAVSAVGKANLDDEQKSKWIKKANQQLAKNAKILFEEKKVCKILEDAAIPFVIIKGSAAAQYYPKPELRTFGDIDILVKKECYSEAANLLLSDAYQVKEEFNANSRHTEFFKNDVELELHQNYLWSGDELLQNEIPNRVVKNGIPYFIDKYNGFVILHHIRKHLCWNIGLRHFMDWCIFANAVCNDEFWGNELKPLADEFGLTKLAKALTQLGINKGLIEKQYSWCSDVRNELCEELLKYFLYNGNFNSKRTVAERKVLTLNTARMTPKQLFGTIKEQGLKTIARYAKNYLGTHSIKEIIEQKKEIDRRRKLFKELEIFEEA